MDIFAGFVDFVKMFLGWVLWLVIAGLLSLAVGLVLDLVYLQKRRQFKEAFGRPLGRINSEQVNSLILSKYELLSEMKKKTDKLSSQMEKELLQIHLEAEWENIRAMERAALINGFVLSRESRSALDRVNELVVRHIAPAT